MPADKPKKSVLVIDDDANVAESLRATLEFDGHQVTSILKARDAIGLMQRERFDVVITDILMPDVDGAQVVIAARQNQPGARIIAISGGGTYMTAGEALKLAQKLGATALLEKPFSGTALLDCVNGVPSPKK